MKDFVIWLKKNKIAIVFTSFLLFITGLYIYTQLAKDVFPNAQFPRFQVIADIGFASLETTINKVTIPLENTLKTVPGVLEVRSVTEKGTSTIDLYLKWGSNLDQAYQYIQSRISQVRGELPFNTSIDTIRINTSAYPMSEYGIWSDTLTLKDLYSTVHYDIIPRLIGADGLANLSVAGGEKKEIWIKLNPYKMAYYNIDSTIIENVLSETNNISFIGTVDENGNTNFVLGGERFIGIKDISNIIVTTRMGKPLKLSDIAEILDGRGKIRRIVSVNGHKGLFIDVMKQNEADGLILSKNLDDKFLAIEKEFKGKIHFCKWDLSDFVKSSIHGIMTDIFIGILIILAIVYYVMTRLRYSLPIMIIMPLVLVYEFIILKLTGSTINIMTLGGVSAAIGIIADNAIVITENYVRFRSDGSKNPLAESMSYILPITIYATMVSIIVFIPLNMLGGVSGLFFRPLALTLSTTIIISLITTIFLLPVLIYYFIEKKEDKVEKEKERSFFVKLKKFYLILLNISLKYKKIITSGILVLIMISALVFYHLPTGFLPEWDEGDIVFDYIAPSGLSIHSVDAIISKVEKIVASIPETDIYIRKTGTHLGTPFAPPTTGEIIILLKKNRKKDTFAIMEELSKKANEEVPELDIDLHQILPDRLGDLTGSAKPIVVNVVGKDLNKILSVAHIIKNKLSNIRGLSGIIVNLPPEQDEINATPNLEEISLLGLSVANTFNYSNMALYGIIPTELRHGLEMIPVKLMYSGDFHYNSKDLPNIPIYTPNGGILHLGRLVSFNKIKQIPEIHHKNGTPVVSVNAEINGRALGDVVKDIKNVLKDIPNDGYVVELEGNYKEQQTSFKELLMVLFVSILLILLLLLFIFESYKTSIAVFLGTLASATFVIFGLKLTGTEFDVSSFTGMITVMGIVVNNGILVIDFAERYRAQGMTLDSALLSAGTLRFRPVLITNFAAIAGFLPMALSISHGSEVLRPFSIAMISGLIGSMFFSLIVMPVFYLLFHSTSYINKK